jgi:hypothetical protein
MPPQLDSDALPQMPETVTFYAWNQQVLPLYQIPGFFQHQSFWCVIIREITSEKVATVKLHDPDDIMNTIEIWDIREGDILPISRSLYRVESMKEGSYEAPSGAKVVCRRLDKPPEGISLTAETIPLPFSSRGRTTSVLHNIYLYRTFVPAKGDKPAAVEVIVDQPTQKRNKGGSIVTERVTYTLRAGDLLRIGPHVHKVIRIVSPDPQKHVIGWFEIGIQSEKEKR